MNATCCGLHTHRVIVATDGMTICMDDRRRPTAPGQRDPLARPRLRVRAARLPDHVVRRPRLEDLLGDHRRRPVTLITGPPGAGKTTLTTVALAACDRVVGVDVDGRDNDTGRLAALVVAALVELGAVGEHEVDVGDRPRTLLDTAFASLGRAGERVVLVLDDVHELISSDALATLDYLVQHAPSQLDLVICSRADPPVRFTRRRLDGGMTDIRTDDLAFDLPEACQLLEDRGVRLTRAQVRALWQRTHGWAAGLRLAACSLQGDDDPRELVGGIAGCESLIIDYLLDELLSRQDEAGRSFLLRTSVAERLTLDLARELTDDPDTGARLDDLRRNGMVMSEVAGGDWYVNHGLFAALLRARLYETDHALADQLHQRAAAWFAAVGDPRAAAEHARTAGDWTLVGRLAESRWTARQRAGHWSDDPHLGDVPSYALRSDPALALVAAADACRRGDRVEADRLRTLADDASAISDSGPARPPESAALLDIAYARAFGADDRGRKAVELLRSSARSGGDVGPAQVADLHALALDVDAGDLERARCAADALSSAGGWDTVTAEAQAVLGLLEVVEGRPSLAWRHRATTADDPGRHSPVTAHARAVSLALCRALRGEHRQAVDALGEAPAGVDPWLRATDAAVRAALRAPGAGPVVVEAGDADRPVVDRALVTMGVLEVVDPGGRVHAVGGPLERDVLVARHRWRAGDAAGALAVLADAGGYIADGHPRTLVERDALVAVAAERVGDAAATVGSLGRALDIAAPTEMMAPLLALALDLAEPLGVHAAALGRHQALAIELADRFRHPAPSPFVERLTDREASVLQHLPTLMSNSEIADGLHLSVNTVKSHLKSLYRKLGVASRREAVQRARLLELL